MPVDVLVCILLGFTYVSIARTCARLSTLIHVSRYEDLSGDGAIGQDDAVIYARSQYPMADSIYRYPLSHFKSPHRVSGSSCHD